MIRPDEFDAAAPRDLSSLTFRWPWAARIFGITLALSERGLFTMREFQAALIESIGAHEKAACISDDETYYSRWIEALVSLLARRAMMSGEALEAAEARVRARLAALHEHDHHHDHGPGPLVRA